VTIINETLDQTCLEIYDKNTAGSFSIINKVINMWLTRNLGLSLTYLRIATSKNSVHLTNKVHCPIQQLSIVQQNATRFGPHEPTICTACYDNIKRTYVLKYFKL